MLRFVAVAVLIVAAGSPRAAPLKDDPEVASQLRLLDEWIRTQVDYTGLPGLVVGIVRDQEVVSLEAYGMADLDRKVPMRPDAIFRIASQSKMFTAIAAMRLREGGRLQLDEPVRRQLSWFRPQPAAESPDITLRHILTHTAGLPREAPFPYWSDLEFPEVAKLKDGVAGQAQAYPAATRWKYSNLGMAVAGLLVEKAAGRSYRDYVTAEVLSPLGMTSTSAGAPPPELRGRLAMGYGRRMPDGSRERIPFVDARAMDPAGGFSSSAGDLLRFLSWQMRLRGDGAKTEILKPSTLREMQRVQWLWEDWTRGWGLGFAITHTPGRDLVGHGGVYPGYTTVTVLSPDEKVGVVVLTNASDGRPVRYALKALEWVAPALVKAAAGPAKPAGPDPSWAAYAGTYRSRWGDTKVLVLGGKLVAVVPLEDDFMDTKLVLEPSGAGTFRIEGRGYVAHGEQARFEVDATGKVTRLFLGMNYAERVDAAAPVASAGAAPPR